MKRYILIIFEVLRTKRRKGLYREEEWGDLVKSNEDNIDAFEVKFISAFIGKYKRREFGKLKKFTVYLAF